MARMMPTVVYFDSESWSPRAQRARTVAGTLLEETWLNGAVY